MKDRLNILADCIAGIVVLSIVAYTGAIIVGVYGASAASITGAWFGLYAFILTMSATKLYGKNILKTVKESGLTSFKP